LRKTEAIPYQTEGALPLCLLSDLREQPAMQNLTLTVPHQLGRDEAKRRIQEGIGQLQQQHGNLLGQLDQQWDGNTLQFKTTVMGQSISGHAVVEDSVVRLEVALPWMLAMLAGPVKNRIEERGRKLLEKR
jgi:hypothetical protein